MLRKKLLSDLSDICSDAQEKQEYEEIKKLTLYFYFRLQELSTNKQRFIEEVEKPMVGLIDILKRFPTLQKDMTADDFFQITDRLMVRLIYLA
jgi:hypothetical protein